MIFLQNSFKTLINRKEPEQEPQFVISAPGGNLISALGSGSATLTKSLLRTEVSRVAGPNYVPYSNDRCSKFYNVLVQIQIRESIPLNCGSGKIMNPNPIRIFPTQIPGQNDSGSTSKNLRMFNPKICF
jgi:hypothetical protein